jgi:hypothetical protein
LRRTRFGVVRAFMPSDLSTRRTVVSEVPIPKNLLIKSRMRRLPERGACRCVVRIAFARSSGGFFKFGCSACFFTLSASSPRFRYAFTHITAVLYGTPNLCATAKVDKPLSITERTTASRTCAGHGRRLSTSWLSLSRDSRVSPSVFTCLLLHCSLHSKGRDKC